MGAPGGGGSGSGGGPVQVVGRAPARRQVGQRERTRMPTDYAPSPPLMPQQSQLVSNRVGPRRRRLGASTFLPMHAANHQCGCPAGPCYHFRALAM